MNITKKLAVSSTLIASLVLSPVAAFADGEGTQATTQSTTQTTAQTTTQTTTQASDDIEVGMTPDSFFYFFKQLVRDINVYFADDEKEKAELLLQYANEKAAELKVLNEANNTEYNEEQMKEIEDLLTEANQLIGGVEAEQSDDAEQADGTEQTDGDVTTEPTPEPTSTSTTTEPQDQQQQPQDEQQAEVDGEMGPAHALAVLKSLLDKLPEQGRKGVENAIKHLEKNIEKQAKKHKKHQEKETTETEAPATATTDATTGTSATTTAPATGAAASATTSASAQAPAAPATTTPAPSAPATMPVHPDVQPEATAPAASATAPVTKERHDNGLHLGWDKQKEQPGKAKEHKEENHGKDK